MSTGIGLDEENPSSIQSATSQHTDQRTQEFGGIVGKSALMQTVLRRLRSLALGDPVVLLTGEPGTGKELMARTIHHLSSRRGAEFIVLDCGAIPHGLRIAELLGRSKEGSVRPPFLSPSREATLVLKEIGHLSLGQQTALVQALHDQDSAKTHNRHMGARVIATSSQDLPAKVAQQSLRADLFFRLNIVTLRVPALRDRRDDIPLLVQHFVRKYGTAAGKDIAILPETMMQSLLRWEWPGNVRELEQLVDRAVSQTSGPVLHECLPEFEVAGPAAVEQALRTLERQHIVQILEKTEGRVIGDNGAAARLGLTRTALQSKMRRLGIWRVEEALEA